MSFHLCTRSTAFVSDADFVDALDMFYARVVRRCVFCGAVKEHLADVFQVLPNELQRFFRLQSFWEKLFIDSL